MNPTVIAIDGPAGSGKTVVGKRLADAIGYRYLDTGAFYRAITYVALSHGVDIHDGVALAEVARNVAIAIERPTVDDGRAYTVFVAGRDVTTDLTGSTVSEAVSIVAAHPEVRTELLPLQQRVAEQGCAVMAGRDIGTVVYPGAGLKLYLDAPLVTRVTRRIEQLAAQGRLPDPARVADEMAERDRIDQSRSTAPLKPATDAVVIDTSTMTIDEELAIILAMLPGLPA